MLQLKMMRCDNIQQKLSKTWGINYLTFGIQKGDNIDKTC